MSYSRQFLNETIQIAQKIDPEQLEAMARAIVAVRERGGRLFFIGVGGGAGHASHAVCDFRKLANIESYTPTDNASELTAQTNDNGWENVMANWLAESRLNAKDGVFVFSVGGGDAVRNISANLVRALDLAKRVGATVLGVVGRDGGYTAKVADACLVVPTVNDKAVTPHTEGWQAVAWHLLVSHPLVQQAPMKWESTVR